MRSAILGTCLAFALVSPLGAETELIPLKNQETCREGYFWQSIVNRTSYHVRVFVDGESWSMDLYTIRPGGLPATRCIPRGAHTLTIRAITFEDMPIGRGKISVVRGEKVIRYESELEPHHVNFIAIGDADLAPVSWYGAENMGENIGLVMLAAVFLGLPILAGTLLIIAKIRA